MKKVWLALGIIIFSLSLSAQVPGTMPRSGVQLQAAAPNIGHVYGKVVDSSGKSIGSASVLLLQSRLHTMTKKSKDILVKGISTQANGDFSFEDLPVRGTLKLKISATGFKPYERNIIFQMPAGGRPVPNEEAANIPASAGTFEKDLGKISLKTDVQQLQDVTVTATTGRLKMDIDKKVFSVDRNIVSTGGTTVDVMKNIPSVNVDIDGNVALRNAAPQIFVDGRPTILTLDQIPADAIESVEVITNPSAKYDASGGGAGILNIVLKKNRKTGYNGNVRAGVDKLGAVNRGLDFNYRENKINVFGSINFNQRKSNTLGTVNRLNLLDTPQTNINQNITDKSMGRFIFARAGFDYFVTNRTTLSLAGFRANGKFSPYESMDINTDSLYNGGTTSSYSNRISNGTRAFNGRGVAFGSKTLFPKAGEEWTADANYFSGNSNNSSLYTTNYYSNVPGNSIAATGLQKIIGTGTDPKS